MGKYGKGVPFEEAAQVTLGARRAGAAVTRLVDEGKVDVPGAEAAEFLRIEKDLELEPGGP